MIAATDTAGVIVTAVYLILVLSLWVFCVWIGANMANRRGRSGWMGGILGGIFGVIGLLIIWGLGDKRRVAA